MKKFLKGLGLVLAALLLIWAVLALWPISEFGFL